MKAKFYISAYCLFFGSIMHAQQHDFNEEKQDNQPPAVTVTDIEQDAREASHSRKEYTVKKEELNAPASKKEKEGDNKQIAVTNTAEKASKKPEKQ
jgi:hypothetical protein